MQRPTFSEALVRRAARGEPDAQARLWLFLRQRFFGLAVSIVRDPHIAEEVLEDSFINVLERVGGHNFSWSGAAQFVSYFKSAVYHTAISSVRKLKTRANKEYILVAKDEEADNPDDPLECIPDPNDPIAREEEYQQRARKFKQAYRALINASQGPSQRLVLQAYRELAEIPGGDRWSRRQKNQFLRERTGMSPSQLAPTKSRLEAKCWQILKDAGLVRERNLAHPAFHKEDEERDGEKDEA